MFDCVNSHLVKELSSLDQENLYNVNVLFGVEIRRENTLTKNLIEKLCPGRVTIMLFPRLGLRVRLSCERQ